MLQELKKLRFKVERLEKENNSLREENDRLRDIVGNRIDDDNSKPKIHNETLLLEGLPAHLQEFSDTDEPQMQTTKGLPVPVETKQIFTFQEQPIEDTKKRNIMDVRLILNESSPTSQTYS
jgi:hypothetical protein